MSSIANIFEKKEVSFFSDRCLDDTGVSDSIVKISPKRGHWLSEKNLNKIQNFSLTERKEQRSISQKKIGSLFGKNKGKKTKLKKKNKHAPNKKVTKHVNFPENYLSFVYIDNYKKFNYENSIKIKSGFDNTKCKCTIF